ncbi:MAG TPA: hypothetical protein VGN96_02415 [Roseococcus sp.]|jgi:hypothetical protein|nr:hypothetical protein [Roseococcus sp.]
MTMQQTVDALRAQATGRAHWFSERHPYRCSKAGGWHDAALAYTNVAAMAAAGTCHSRTMGARAEVLADVAEHRRRSHAARRRCPDLTPAIWQRGQR